MSWKEINKPWREYSYPDRPKAGALLRVSSRGLVETWLVGDINEMGGTCDDCRMFADSDIVVAEFDLATAIEAAKEVK